MPATSAPSQVSASTLAELNAYLSNGIHEVQGWCIPQLWQMIWPLRAQIDEGAVAEIGVFEGKFVIGLAKTFGASATRRATALDVFDMQEFNLYKAGVGKKAVLAQNMRKFGIPDSAFEAVEADPLSLRQAEAEQFILDRGRVAFLSVDGCHEVVHTTRDTEFAMQVTRHDGIISVDDYTNPNWPGVQEAIARMYLMRDFSFVPLAVGCNNLLLCSYSYHSRYLQAIHSYISAHHPRTRMKKCKRFGFDTLTVQPDMKGWSDLHKVA